MSTLVCFHAHPDDEAIGTGGLMAKAAASGHRVVLITATNGEQGEPKPGVLDEGEALADRRLIEVAQSAEVLGAELILLGYEDSGMMGEPANDNPHCFWQADLEAAAQRLAQILADLSTDVLTVYDPHGLYGHPDHIKVHEVGVRAAEIAAISNVYMGTVNRDRALAGFAAMREQVGPDADLPDPDDFAEFGMTEDDLAFDIDVSDFSRRRGTPWLSTAPKSLLTTFFSPCPTRHSLRCSAKSTMRFPARRARVDRSPSSCCPASRPGCRPDPRCSLHSTTSH